MATSQNGWTVLETAPPAVLIPGTDIKLSLRPGDVAYLLTRVASWFHHNIERLDMPVREEPGRDDWGWAYRPVRGQSSGFSNHASGTAEDLNATQHPRGVKNTFSDDEEVKVLHHLNEYRDPVTKRCIIRWGEQYSTTVDGMHFEINGTPAEVARVADMLRARDARHTDNGEQDDMQTSDVLKLGPGNAAVLGETADKQVTVGEAIVGGWATSRQVLTELKGLRSDIQALTAAIKAQPADPEGV